MAMNKSKGRVLIVDDEVYIQEILQATLEDAGFECLAVGNVDDALSALATRPFDITFTDIRMPADRGPLCCSK
jgi:DNA-binding NtrC family response regulator